MEPLVLHLVEMDTDPDPDNDANATRYGSTTLVEFYQCCGSESGSIGSTCFWASWIRIRIRIHKSEVWIRIRILFWIRIRILLSLSNYSKKNLDFYCFVTSF